MTEEQIEKLKDENKKLKNRCIALTKGLLCTFCQMECENRNEKFVEEEPDDE